MGFRLEDIKLEGIKITSNGQYILSEYSLKKNRQDNFCLLNIFCGEYESCPCECEDVSTTQGEYPSRYCRSEGCAPHESTQLY
jgi:hypothetical protein